MAKFSWLILVGFILVVLVFVTQDYKSQSLLIEVGGPESTELLQMSKRAAIEMVASLQANRNGEDWDSRNDEVCLKVGSQNVICNTRSAMEVFIRAYQP